jgi:hypothetical protein
MVGEDASSIFFQVPAKLNDHPQKHMDADWKYKAG